MSQRQGMSPSGLGSVLGQEAQRIGTERRRRIGSAPVLDQDGDGKFGIGDVLKMGEGLLGSRGGGGGVAPIIAIDVALDRCRV